jgi:hypothetical protein
VTANRLLEGWAGPLAAGLIALVAYALSLSSSLAGGDAGELVTAAQHLEVAHPPGYPLYTLVGHAFTWLPTTPTRALSWMSAGCETAAVAGMMHLGRTLSGRPCVGLATALAFAFSPIVWEWAIAPEVFALHHLLIVALLCAIDSAARQPAVARAALAGLAGGLAMSHHHTAVFLVLPALVVLVIAPLPTCLSRRRWVSAALVGGSVGLLPNLLLVLFSSRATTLSLGDPSTPSGLLRHLLRQDYGTLQLADQQASGDGGSCAARVLLMAEEMAEALLWVGLPLLIIGMVVALSRASGERHDRHRVGAVRFLLTSLVLYIGVFNALANLPTDPPLFTGVLARFAGQAIVLTLLIAAAGMGRMAMLRQLPLSVAVGLCLLPLIAGGIRAPGVVAMHGDEVERYGEALLAPLPQGAVLLTRGDLATNAVRYLQRGLERRPDVLHLDQEMLTRDWYVERASAEHGLRFPGSHYGPDAGGFLLADLLAMIEERAVFVYPEVKPGDHSLSGAGWQLLPQGLASRVSRVVSEHDVLSAIDRARALSSFPPAGDLPAASWRRVVADDVSAALHRSGTFLLSRALPAGRDSALLDAAQELFERAAARIEGPVPWWLNKNLGLVHAQRADDDDNARAKTIGYWRGYLDAAPSDEKDRVAIAAAVAQYEKLGGSSSSSREDDGRQLQRP